MLIYPSLLSVDFVPCLFESLLLPLVLPLTTPSCGEVGGRLGPILGVAYVLAYLLITQVRQNKNKDSRGMGM